MSIETPRLRAPAHHVDPRAITGWRPQRRPRLLSVTAAVAAGKGAHTIARADQDEVLPAAADAVPGRPDPFLEPDPHGCQA